MTKTIQLKLKKYIIIAIIITLTFSLFCCTKKMGLKQNQAVSIGKLNNGLTYIVKENQKPKGQASIRLAVASGSIHENEDQKGIAHFVEHLAFNGSKKFPQNELIDFLEKMGIEFGPELNAYTSYDKTVYKLEVPLDAEKNLETAIQILRGWSDGLLMEDNEIDKEREIIIQEWRDGLGAGSRLRDAYLPLLFKNSIYETRKPIGDPEIIKNISYKRIQDFYKKWYRADRIAIIAVGDFKSQIVIEKIKRIFSDMKKNENPIKFKNTIPDQEGTDYAILSDPEETNSFCWIINRLPQKEKSEMDQFKQEIKISIANRIINNRFEEKLNSGSEGIISSHANKLDFILARSFYITAVNLYAKSAKKGIKSWNTEIERLRTIGASQSEIEQAVAEMKQILDNIAKEKESLESIQECEAYVEDYLNQSTITDPLWTKRKGNKIISKLKKEDINQTLSLILQPKNRVYISVSPESNKKLMPSQKEVETIFQESKIIAGKEKKESKKNTIRTKDLEIKERKKGSIISKKKLEKIQSEIWELSNGAKVAIRPSKLTKNKFYFLAWSAGGTSLADDTLFPSAELADDLVAESGIANLSRAEKIKWYKRTGISATLSIDELKESISGEGKTDHLEESIKLLAALFTEVNPTKKEFQKVKSEVISYAKNQEKDPKVFFQKRLNQILRQKGERDTLLSEKVAKKAQFQKTANFYKSRFADASDFTFVFTGNFNIGELENLIEKYIASLPSDNNNQNLETYQKRYSKYPRKDSKTTIKKGIEKQALIYCLYHKDYNWNINFNLKINAATDCLDRILGKEIREKNSGTYSISSFGILKEEPYPEIIGGIVFSCKPDRQSNLENQRDKILNQFLEGFDSQLLKNYKKIQINNFKENQQKDIWWMEMLKQVATEKRSVKEIITTEKRINALTQEKVLAAAKVLFLEGINTQVILVNED